MPAVTRRDFLHSSAALATAASIAASASVAKAAAADVLNIALIGCGGMGTNHLSNLLARKDVKLSYVCDVNAKRLADAAKKAETAGSSVQAVKDLRKILDDKSIDAVWIATPDHWHSPAAILAVDAGKHVYVEKPVSHNIREGRLLMEAGRKQKKVVQVGTQSRSSAHCLRAIEILREGTIGEVKVAKAWNSQLRSPIGYQQPSTPPEYLDFDMWLGPAPKREYQANLLPAKWRWFQDFGAGDIGNDGVHDIDVARWGLGAIGNPSTATGLGSKFFFEDDQQFPDTQYCVFEWPGDGKPASRRQLIFEQRDWSPYVQEGYENGAAFYGTKGMLILGHSVGFQVFGPRNAPGEKGSGAADLVAHHTNFIECVKSGKRPNADVEEGHLSANLVHLANIACRLQKTLHLDPVKEVITDADANRLVRRTYRDGHWAVPKGV